LTEEEIPLTGGMSTPGVVRVGDTVRRPQKPDADYVHALLAHFEQARFEGAPRFLGIDERGRAVFSFVEGFAPPPHNGFRMDEQAVSAGAQLVRSVHDLTEGTEFARGGEVACHPNLSQPNFVFRERGPLEAVRGFQIVVRGDRGAEEWGARELEYMERNAGLFRAHLR
jgi:hypothetical protein